MRTWWATVKRANGDTIWEGRVSGATEKEAFADALSRLINEKGVTITSLKEEDNSGSMGI